MFSVKIQFVLSLSSDTNSYLAQHIIGLPWDDEHRHQAVCPDGLTRWRISEECNLMVSQ